MFQTMQKGTFARYAHTRVPVTEAGYGVQLLARLGYRLLHTAAAWSAAASSGDAFRCGRKCVCTRMTGGARRRRLRVPAVRRTPVGPAALAPGASRPRAAARQARAPAVLAL